VPDGIEKPFLMTLTQEVDDLASRLSCEAIIDFGNWPVIRQPYFTVYRIGHRSSHLKLECRIWHSLHRGRFHQYWQVPPVVGAVKPSQCLIKAIHYLANHLPHERPDPQISRNKGTVRSSAAEDSLAAIAGGILNRRSNNCDSVQPPG
jgi:hypothetical protein